MGREPTSPGVRLVLLKFRCGCSFAGGITETSKSEKADFNFVRQRLLIFTRMNCGEALHGNLIRSS